MNHVWAVTFKDEEGKKILQAEALDVKEHRCVVRDPSNQCVRMKLYWLLHGVRDDDVRSALAPFGKVTDIAKNNWKVSGCVDKVTTTRSVTLMLNAGLTNEDLPHQLRVAEDGALVYVPGRYPLCLWCRGTGHVRRECRVPRCGICRRFGHDETQSVRTYASVAGPARKDEMVEHLMDEVDAAEATCEGTIEGTSKDTPAELPGLDRTPNADCGVVDVTPDYAATTDVWKLRTCRMENQLPIRSRAPHAKRMTSTCPRI
ncbi:uncharacterized protein LOC144116317 [Amblyomma americanum]